MGFDTNGNYTRIPNGATTWQTVAASPDKRIKSGEHDAHDQDIAKALGECLNRNGAGHALNNISMGGFRLTNVGSPSAGTDAVNRDFVTTSRDFTNGATISGANVDGRLTFTSLTGTQGIVWDSTSTALLAKKAVTDREQDRLVVNNGSADVVTIDDDNGTLNYPGNADTTSNLINDQLGTWRTPTAGTGGLFRTGAGFIQGLINYTATTLAYGAVTALKAWFSAVASGGNVTLSLNKKASGNAVQVYGQMDDKARWILELGNSAAEDAPAGGSTGSDFGLHACKNDGSYNFATMSISRNTGRVNFPYGHEGTFNVNGSVTLPANNVVTTTYVNAPATALVLGGNTGIYLRPNGYSNDTGRTLIDGSGNMNVTGSITCGSMNVTGSITCGSTATVGSTLVFGQNIVSSTPNVYIATTGTTGGIYLRPNGLGSTAEQTILTAGGDWQVSNQGGIYAGFGLRERVGNAGAYGNNWINFNWVSGNTLNAYIDSTIFTIAGTLCDYRIKQAVQPLSSTWAAVKALRPVSYRYRDYDEIIRDDGVERRGFLAHEVQEAIGAAAATGTHDGADLQGLDLITIISTLTSALQEAMVRIEALEARP